ncbi:MAG: galactokinase [Pirellulaceae bacterium]|nr:galactokinase [Pirellulaceae bacterium]
MNDQEAINAGDNPAIDKALSLENLASWTEEQFQQRFGQPPTWVAAAPGRVNLIGEHTDYNDGFVLPMAIDRYVVMAAAPSTESDSDRPVRVCSHGVDQTERLSPDIKDPAEVVPWARYVLGVMVGCHRRGMTYDPLDILVESTVPLGGGLSSSAALEVATATLLEAVTGKTMDSVEKALLCQKAEHEYAGMPCGIMDQFTSVMGLRDHLMLLDCRSRDVKLVRMDDADITVLIINTNVKHELTGGEYAERRSQCEAAAEKMGVASLRDATFDLLGETKEALEPVFQRRARHVIGEIERTTETVASIEAGDWARVGELMYASHDSLRDDYEVSCVELDLLVELAKKQGESGAVIGSRMTGGGFGGCTVSLVPSGDVESVARSIRAEYQRRTGIEPSIFTTRPAQGAHIVRG